MTDEILYRYFRNEARPDEITRIEEWLAADAAHQAEFDAAHMLFNTSVLQQAHYTARPQPRMRPKGIVRRMLRIAAAIAVIAGAGLAGGFISQRAMHSRLSHTENVIEVPAGERMSLILHDGTVVHLNGGSRLEYPLLFGERKRHVKLSGEALFEVSHDSRHPFVVETFASEIEVLGTRFDVYADERNNRFSATLVNGRVKVTNLVGDSRNVVVLNPDEMVRLVGKHLVPTRVNDPDALCWTEGYVNLRNVAFDELMQRFENAYGVRIRIERPDLPRIGYTSGKIRISEGIDFGLRLLQRACDFTYTKDEEGTIIIH